MSFETDSRWDEVIAMMNWLSLNNYTGMVKFSLVSGRVHRRTVEDFRHVVSLVKQAQPQEEARVYAEA